MTKEFSPDRLDVRAFAQAQAHLEGQDPLSQYKRLALEAEGPHDDVQIRWAAQGELRTEPGALSQTWLHLQAEVDLPMVCQRCLTRAFIPVDVDRSFRFVADEATAEALDDESEEDLLALSKDFALRDLIEDELLMELPVVPMHDVCPEAVPLASSDEDFNQATSEKPNPFAALASLRIAKPKPEA